MIKHRKHLLQLKHILQIVLCFGLMFIYSCQQPNLSSEDLKHGVKLELSDSAFNFIKTKRNQALKDHFLVKTKSDYVQGNLICNGKNISVEARLKGDLIDHFKTNRWSFRIKSKSGNILNQKRFSIQGAHTRTFINEWVYHRLLMELNVLNLQYEFYPFSVNDTLNGFYAFESYLDNYLLERMNRPIGPILKFDETEFWNKVRTNDTTLTDNYLMQHANIKLCNKKWGKQKENIKLVEQAKKSLKNFQNKTVQFREVFDLQSWSKFIAINEIMAATHSLRWHNLRFYFNPVSQKFEPIGFDSGGWVKSSKPIFHHNNESEVFFKNMFKDSSFVKLIDEELIDICNSKFLESFFDLNRAEISNIELEIKKERKHYKFDEIAFYNSKERILNLLKSRHPF